MESVKGTHVHVKKLLVGIDEVGLAVQKASLAPRLIIGIDEVGRGPLAGPITVAAVATKVNYESGSIKYALEGIRDSKKLSANQRITWSVFIKKNFIYSVHSISPRVIDTKGVTHAARLAVETCIKKISKRYTLNYKHVLILLDGGLYAPSQYKNQQTIIRGDEKEPLIAAASIVAKVHRDRYMMRLAVQYPQYGFEKHKGYGTVVHRKNIIQYGLSPIHRKSFCTTVLNLKCKYQHAK
jgi:ribonuclease HII